VFSLIPGQESIQIPDMEGKLETEKEISRQAPCSDRAVDVIKLLNIDENDKTSSANDDVGSEIKLFQTRQVEHEDYKHFQRTTSNAVSQFKLSE